MPVRYGFIGCGAIAQRRHLPECAANPDSVVAALADPVEERVKELAKKYKAKAFTDWQELIQSKEVDAVVVAGPNALHAPQSIAALQAGLHVLCEKPMATTREDGKAMIAAARKNKKYLMIGLNQRLAPVHVKAKEILLSGALGKVLTFRTAFKHPGPEAWSVDGARSWFFRKPEALMGVTGDLGVHKADLMRWLLDQEFVQVSALLGTFDKKDTEGKKIELDDNAYLTLKTAKGVIGSMMLSWTNYGSEENYTILYCSKGVLRIGTDPTYGVIVEYKNGNRELHKVGAMATNLKQVASGVIDSFTESILKQRPPKINGLEGYRAMDVILTAMEAAATNQVLPIAQD